MSQTPRVDKARQISLLMTMSLMTATSAMALSDLYLLASHLHN